MSYSDSGADPEDAGIAAEPFVQYGHSSPLAHKSFRFATRIVDLVRELQSMERDKYSVVVFSSPKELVISRQMVRSGTSIGAQIHEGVYAQSTPDFISKMSIALKEAHETQYWLRLLEATGYITIDGARSYLMELEELPKMLTASIKTAKNRLAAS